MWDSNELSGDYSKLVQEGNSQLAIGTNISQTSSARKSCLNRAVQYFHQASLRSCGNRNQEAESKKMYGITSLNYAFLFWESFKEDDDISSDKQGLSSIIGRRMMNGFNSLVEAEAIGLVAINDHKWLEELRNITNTKLGDTLKLLTEFESDERGECLQKLSSLFTVSLAHSTAYTNVPELFYQSALWMFQEGSKCIVSFRESRANEKLTLAHHRCCLTWMRDCYSPLTNALECCKFSQSSHTFKEKVERLREYTFQYECICEAVELLVSGMKILERATTNQRNGEMDVDSVWTAVDKFREAARKVHGKDNEMEGMALCNFGKGF